MRLTSWKRLGAVQTNQVWTFYIAPAYGGVWDVVLEGNHGDQNRVGPFETPDEAANAARRLARRIVREWRDA